jgi:hypothetical protein
MSGGFQGLLDDGDELQVPPGYRVEIHQGEYRSVTLAARLLRRGDGPGVRAVGSSPARRAHRLFGTTVVRLPERGALMNRTFTSCTVERFGRRATVWTARRSPSSQS